MSRTLPTLAALALAAVAVGQQPDSAVGTDWHAEVVRACTHSRYGLRLAASRKVAEAGDVAVPAVRAFQEERGRDAMPLALVETLAERGGNGPAMLALLREWAADRDFYWRGQAMLGLARRAHADAAISRAHDQLFAEHLQDPAWLCRAHAHFGWLAAGAHDPQDHRVWTPQPDPRGSTRLAALLLGQGDPGLVDELLHSLLDRRTFLGDPWGERRAQEAFQALRAWAGDDFGYRVDLPPDELAAAAARFARRAHGADAELPALLPITDPEIAVDGGLEVLSCRNGDLFLRWNQHGMLFAGLDWQPRVQLPADGFRAWLGRAADLRGDPQQGVVICDRLRLKLDAPGLALHCVIAPAAMPAATADWLKQLAAMLEEVGQRELADALRNRLQQFAPGGAGG